MREFRDASYADWKTTAEEHTDEDTLKKPAPLSSEMGAAPAFAMDEPTPAEARSTQVLEKGQTVTLESPADYSATIQVAPPPRPVPDWAVASAEPAAAAEVAPAQETPAGIPDVMPDAESRESGVGKLLSKAKSFFGGAAIEESPIPRDTVALSAKGDTLPMAASEMAPPPDLSAAAADVAPPAGFAAAPDLAPPPSDFAAAPADLTPPAPDWGGAPAMEMEEAPSFEAAAEIPSAEVPFEAVAAMEPAHMDEAAAHHAAEIEHTAAPQGMDVAHEIDPALDTSMHHGSHADVPVEINPDLDTSMHRDSSEVASGGLDPALVTDPTEMASAFPTNFGVAGATIDPVGVAADVHGLYDNDQIEVAPAEAGAEVAPMVAEVPEPAMDAAPQVEEPVAGWRAEEHHLEDHEHGVKLEHEMAKHYASQAAVAEPEAAPAPTEAESPAAAAAQTNAPDMQFAAAMAAAVGAEMPAGSGDRTSAMDPEMLARIVQRVTERMKPSLIAEITKELMSEQQKEKK